MAIPSAKELIRSVRARGEAVKQSALDAIKADLAAGAAKSRAGLKAGLEELTKKHKGEADILAQREQAEMEAKNKEFATLSVPAVEAPKPSATLPHPSEFAKAHERDLFRASRIKLDLSRGWVGKNGGLAPEDRLKSQEEGDALKRIEGEYNARVKAYNAEEPLRQRDQQLAQQAQMKTQQLQLAERQKQTAEQQVLQRKLQIGRLGLQRQQQGEQSALQSKFSLEEQKKQKEAELELEKKAKEKVGAEGGKPATTRYQQRVGSALKQRSGLLSTILSGGEDLRNILGGV